MQLIYLLVSLVCLWVLFHCWCVWPLIGSANQHRKETHFVQHQVAFIGLSALYCLALCVVSWLLIELPEGVMRRWWGMLGVFACLVAVNQLKDFQRSLSAGRQG